MRPALGASLTAAVLAGVLLAPAAGTVFAAGSSARPSGTAGHGAVTGVVHTGTVAGATGAATSGVGAAGTGAAAAGAARTADSGWDSSPASVDLRLEPVAYAGPARLGGDTGGTEGEERLASQDTDDSTTLLAGAGLIAVFGALGASVAHRRRRGEL
ncbi:hypothetical protein [Streptomyces sp. NPDC097619]|uniref:hypothetical protein n=1 Tax=Streptomyces sp. NPDC097619 TaxID=3157228 RepID=UPI003329ABEA